MLRARLARKEERPGWLCHPGRSCSVSVFRRPCRAVQATSGWLCAHMWQPSAIPCALLHATSRAHGMQGLGAMAPREPLVDTTLPRMPSSFVERLDAVIERWASILPLHLRPELRDEFQAFGIEHDRT